MKLYCCGSRGSWPVEGRAFNEFGGNTSCYVLKVKKYALVIDVGTGFYNAQSILKDCERIDVVLTHLHYDHILGLLDWTDFPEDRLTFYGSFDEWLGQNSLSEFFREPFWPVMPTFNIKNIPPLNQPLVLPHNIEIDFYPSSHPNASKELIIRYKDHKIVVMFDNEKADSLALDLIKDADILIYDGMYSDDEYASKVGYGHSTYQEGARLALKAKPNRLIITHHNPVNEDITLREFEEEARLIYPYTNFARAGQTWEFPMPKPDLRVNDLDYVDLNIKEKIKNKYGHLFNQIKEYGNRDYYTILIANLFFAAFSLIFTIVDYSIIKNIPYQIFLLITALFMVNFLLLLNKKERYKIVKTIFAIEACMIMIGLLITSNNIAYGFSWFLLLPVGGFFIFGIKAGFMMAGLLYVCLILLLRTEFGNSLFVAQLPFDAKTKLPMLFFNYVVICSLIETVRAAFSIELQKITLQQETVIQEQTQELRDQNYSLLEANEQLQMRNELLSKTFGSFMPDEAVLNRLKSEDGTSLQSRKDVVTILKCGIRNFADILASDDTEKVVDQINYHFNKLSQIIEKNNGLVIEYAGDSFVAVFGALEKGTNHQCDAVASGLEIQKEMVNIKKYCRDNNFGEYDVGVAIHTGEAVLAAFGSNHQLKYGIIGPTVSITFLMEKETKGNEVSISEDCYENLSSTVHVTDITNFSVKFNDTRINCYTIDGIGLPYCISLKDE